MEYWTRVTLFWSRNILSDNISIKPDNIEIKKHDTVWQVEVIKETK